MRPRLSVCIPTRNRAELLRRTLQSLSVQSFKDVEVLIYDDGCTDTTPNVVRDFKGKFAELKYLKNDLSKGLLGLAKLINQLTDMAEGEYVAYVQDDNYFHHDYFQIGVQSLDINRTCSFFVPLSTLVNIRGETIYEMRSSYLGLKVVNGLDFLFQFVPPFKLGSGSIPYNRLTTSFASAIFRKDAMKKVGGLDEDLPISSDLITQAKLCLISDVAFLDSPMFYYTVHENWGNVAGESARFLEEYTLLYAKLFHFLDSIQLDLGKKEELRRKVLRGYVDFVCSLDGPLVRTALRYKGGFAVKTRRVTEIAKSASSLQSDYPRRRALWRTLIFAAFLSALPFGRSSSGISRLVHLWHRLSLNY